VCYFEKFKVVRSEEIKYIV